MEVRESNAYGGCLPVKYDKKPNQEVFEKMLNSYSFDGALNTFEGNFALDNEEDWRYMSDKAWDKFIDRIDDYIADVKDKLKEVEEAKEEATVKAASFANSASKSSAIEVAYNQVMSKSQELIITGDTTEGMIKTDYYRETASVETDGMKKSWTVTCYTEEGITCTQTEDGEIITSWKIEYRCYEEYIRVDNFLSKFPKDADFTFAGSKEFWEDFLKRILSAKEENEIIDNILGIDNKQKSDYYAKSDRFI